MRAHLERIDAVNGRFNAIVTLAAERALADARIADDRLASGEPLGPLHGLPIAHKDLQATAGIRTTFGCPVYQDFVPDRDSALVARLRRAGVVALGKTNTPELGAGSQTFNPIFGATLNPFDSSLTCGGSSGGAAVALACGMVPIADGTDMGGSLRNPAAFCGVVGFRPSTGWIATGAENGEPSSWSSLSVDGPMGRSVADVALVLGAIANEAPPPLDRDFTDVRVAWWRDLGGLPFERPIREIVNAQRKVFESMGCRTIEAEPDWSGADACFKVLRARAFVERHGAFVRTHPGRVKETIVSEIERGERLTDNDVRQAESERARLQHQAARFMDSFRFFVLPTTQALPFPVTRPYVDEIEGVKLNGYIDWMRSCYYISILGLPAVSVPCGFTANGLPVGLQIVGRHGDDWAVLQIAHAFDTARGPMPNALDQAI